MRKDNIHDTFLSLQKHNPQYYEVLVNQPVSIFDGKLLNDINEVSYYLSNTFQGDVCKFLPKFMEDNKREKQSLQEFQHAIQEHTNMKVEPINVSKISLAILYTDDDRNFHTDKVLKKNENYKTEAMKKYLDEHYTPRSAQHFKSTLNI